MGINQLLKVLKSISKPRNVSHYANQTIGVDTYCWLHKALYSCAIDIIEGRKPDELISFCLRRIEMLQRHNIKVIMVFDGGKLPMKAKIEDSREKNRMEKLSKGYQHRLEGDRDKAMQRFAEAIDITPQIANYVLKALMTRGIECIVAPYEADAQLAYLSKIGYVDVVITEDSDLLAFGAKRVLYKLNKEGDGEEYALEDIPLCTEVKFSGWNSNMFLTLCVLSGCDYLEQVPNVGFKTAYTQIQRFRNYSLVIEYFRRSGKYVVPLNFEQQFEQAFLTFRFQTVFCPIQRQIITLNPMNREVYDISSDLTNIVECGQIIEKEMLTLVQSYVIDSPPFIGVILDNQIACKIADGELCPISHQPFDPNPTDFNNFPMKQTQIPKDDKPISELSCFNTSNDMGTEESEAYENENENFDPMPIYGTKSQQSRQVFKLNMKRVVEEKRSQPLQQSTLKSYFKSSSNQSSKRPDVHDMLKQQNVQAFYSKMRPFKTPRQVQQVSNKEFLVAERILQDLESDDFIRHRADDLVIKGFGDLPVVISKALLTQRFEFNQFGEMMADKIKFDSTFYFKN